MEKSVFTETKKFRDQPYDEWQERTRLGNEWKSVAPQLPPVSAGIAELAAKYRFLPGENAHRFKIRMGIDGQYTLTEWATASGYPVGADVTPAEDAAWLQLWQATPQGECGKAVVFDY